MKISTRVMAILVFALLVGGIGLSIALGAWSTKSEKIPATYGEGEAAGEYNPADIRGSYTFGEVSSLFEHPVTDLDEATGGLMIKSENWQALNLLQERYEKQVKCAYIDPPYSASGPHTDDMPETEVNSEAGIETYALLMKPVVQNHS